MCTCHKESEGLLDDRRVKELIIKTLHLRTQLRNKDETN